MNTRKLFVFLVGAAITIPVFTYSGSFAETTTQTATPAPKVAQVIGNTTAVYGPTRYPQFIAASGDNSRCEAYIKTVCSDHECKYPFTDGKGDGSADTGIGLAPLWLKSTQSSQSPASELMGWQSIADGKGDGKLLISGFKVPANFKTTSKILISWAVRVEGYKTSAYNVSPRLCRKWHGTTSQQFTGGQVYTRAFINGTAMGPVALMSIPDAGISRSNEPRPPKPKPVIKWDPTVTGSCLLSKDDFGGEFPDAIDIEIKWYNDTCMKIESPANMRSLNITMLPLGSRQE